MKPGTGPHPHLLAAARCGIAFCCLAVLPPWLSAQSSPGTPSQPQEANEPNQEPSAAPDARPLASENPEMNTHDSSSRASIWFPSAWSFATQKDTPLRICARKISASSRTASFRTSLISPSRRPLRWPRLSSGRIQPPPPAIETNRRPVSFRLPVLSPCLR